MVENSSQVLSLSSKNIKNNVCHFFFIFFLWLCFRENNFLIKLADMVLAYILRGNAISFRTFTEVKLSTLSKRREFCWHQTQTKS